MLSTLVFFLLLTHIFSKKLYTKVIHTPIYEPLKMCRFHNIVLMKKTPFNDDQQEYKETYAIDFSPADNIADWRIVLKLLLGKSIKGKLRLVYFDRIDEESMQKDILSREPTISFETIYDIDPDLYDKIINWKPLFQLYNHNCKHFSRYLSE